MKAMKVVVKIRPEKRKEFLQTLSFLDADRTGQDGSGRSMLYETDDNTGFCLVYTWATQEALERYLDSEQYRVLQGALEVLGEGLAISVAEGVGFQPTDASDNSGFIARSEAN
jgi:quinol monooxygenase YgiN